MVIVPKGAWSVDGLQAPAAEAVWPDWQVRVTVRSAGPLSLAEPSARIPPSATFRGGALLGDYTFARPWFGNLHASGGVMVGRPGPLALAGALAETRSSLALGSAADGPTQPGFDNTAASTYLGVGYSNDVWLPGFSISADLGMTAESPAAAFGVGRAIFGSQGLDSALRDVRLSPVVQLGMRYSF